MQKEKSSLSKMSWRDSRKYESIVLQTLPDDSSQRQGNHVFLIKGPIFRFRIPLEVLKIFSSLGFDLSKYKIQQGGR